MYQRLPVKKVVCTKLQPLPGPTRIDIYPVVSDSYKIPWSIIELIRDISLSFVNTKVSFSGKCRP